METKSIILKNKMFILGSFIFFLLIHQTNADVISINSYGSNEVVVTGWTDQIEGFFFKQKSTEASNPISEPRRSRVLENINKIKENETIEKVKIINKTKDILNKTTINKAEEQNKNKFYTVFLNFLEISDKFKKALFLDSQDIKGIIKDIEILKNKSNILIQKVRTQYLLLIKEKTTGSIAYFKNEVNKKDFHELISPCVSLKDYLEKKDISSRISKIIKEIRKKLVTKDF